MRRLRPNTRSVNEVCKEETMDTVKQNADVARQNERIMKYYEALAQKAGKHETDKSGKRNNH